MVRKRVTRCSFWLSSPVINVSLVLALILAWAITPPEPLEAGLDNQSLVVSDLPMTLTGDITLHKDSSTQANVNHNIHEGDAPESEPIEAGLGNQVPFLAGFPATLTGGAAIHNGSPTLADVNNDGKLEIFIGGGDATNPQCLGRLYGVSSTGSVMWNIQVRAPVESAPAVADIDGDGVAEVVVGMGSAFSEGCASGGVLAVNALTGVIEWTFNTQDWNGHVHNGFSDAVHSSPLIADFFSGGDKEIVFGSFDQCLYMLDGHGNPIWPDLTGIPGQVHCGGHGFYNEDTFWSSPAAADLNGDGQLEIVMGADATTGNRNGDPSGGYLYVLDANGTQLARRWFDQSIYSSPAVGDLDGDGVREIVVGTGYYMPGKGYYVTAWNFVPGAPVTLTLMQKYWWTTSGRVFSSPALADLTGDGNLDVIAIVNIGDGPWTGGQNLGSKVFAWNGKTGAKLFETRICNWQGQSFSIEASPTIADIDGDGLPEIFFSHGWEVGILNHDGIYYTDYSSIGPANPACARGTPPETTKTLNANWSVFDTLAIGDLNGDGRLEVVAGGGTGPSGNPAKVFAWRFDVTGTKTPWPMFHRDAQHTGRYPIPPTLAVSPGSLYLIHQSGDPRNEYTTLMVQNTGELTFTLSVTPPPSVTVWPTSGTIVTQTTLMITVATTGRPSGIHNLGNITITGKITTTHIAGSPVNVPVTLYVGQLYRSFLPVVLKSFGP